jgi:hypothetical protein
VEFAFHILSERYKRMRKLVGVLAVSLALVACSDKSVSYCGSSEAHCYYNDHFSSLPTSLREKLDAQCKKGEHDWHVEYTCPDDVFESL